MFATLGRAAVILMAFTGIASLAARGDVTLAQDGQTRAVIVVEDGAGAPDVTAASELATYLNRVTGAQFKIVSETEASGESASIFIGQSDSVKSLLPGFDWESLGHDGIVMKTVGRDLVLAGGRPRGALYAVYSFMEDVVGCRWWTSEAEYTPSRQTLKVGELDVVYVPPFAYREGHWRAVYDNRPGPRTDFAVRLKLNGHFNPIPADHGGHYTLLGWAHTFHWLLPGELYFKDHPEWYSQIDAKRTARNSQLCLTNPGMRAELTRRALEWIKANPNAGMISISQNDNNRPCQCVKCKAVVIREGSESGPLIQFVNLVAQEIEKQYPDFLVETLAYGLTRPAPKYVKPRGNVIVRLCSIECDFGRPLDAEVNKRFYKDLKDWAAISERLYIWNYASNYHNFLVPHPNWRVLGPNVRIFAANKALGIFELGDAFNDHASFNHLKLWMLAHLMWDPQADDRKLTARFLRGYYGDAAEHLQQYLDVICDAVERSSVKISMAGAEGTYLTLSDLNKATVLFNKAEAAVESSPELLRRVQIERLALDHAWLLSDDIDRFVPGSGYPSDYEALAQRFLAKSKEWGAARYLAEGRPIPDNYASKLADRGSLTPVGPAAVPEQCRGRRDTDWLDIQEDRFRTIGARFVKSVTSDDHASNGRATKMYANHCEWATQFHLSEKDASRFKKPEVFVSIRCVARSKTGKACDVAIYDAVKKRIVGSIAVSLADVADGGYHEFSLGRHKLTSGMYIFVAPCNNPNEVEAVYIDRVFFVRKDK